jgi:hypothetical protein
MFGFIEIESKAVLKAAVRLLFCCEEIQAVGHTSSSLHKLETRIIVVLAELESLFPIQWCSQVMHVALHLCLMLRRGGTFRDISMLGFERFHVVIKRLVRGRKNMLASFHTHYEMMVASSAWRCTADRLEQIDAKNGLWRTPGFKSSINGNGNLDIDYSDKVVGWSGHQKPQTLGHEDFDAIRDLWCVQNKRYTKFAFTRTVAHANAGTL